ncbi:hypothetical protein C8Q75DRAFT_581091 [Abortiporus biennis]|nr:hypothetical protein C8Q75DRAFT_581091 [Abortiporus biennis]
MVDMFCETQLTSGDDPMDVDETPMYHDFPSSSTSQTLVSSPLSSVDNIVFMDVDEAEFGDVLKMGQVMNQDAPTIFPIIQDTTKYEDTGSNGKDPLKPLTPCFDFLYSKDTGTDNIAHELRGTALDTPHSPPLFQSLSGTPDLKFDLGDPSLALTSPYGNTIGRKNLSAFDTLRHSLAVFEMELQPVAWFTVHVHGVLYS